MLACGRERIYQYMLCFINVVIVLEQHSVTCVYESCKIVLFQKS
ncbi:hypothetical protein AZO1586I_1272 [Bathymodiolus thermophilus thioautotrophic gill symbiont]|uniref:Uncharacterized protein n=2 Tax=sulfur-oxidizing symbionts TaxID=32036 RepID=A0ACA8ZPE3_9GAMM|nr:hypothetical protein AZO1586R_842 [Bathymodiolus azoricus thioautotrophic gill symbiont]CAB5504351.1 hypothetical protein AZO1586I_1272 [Bathymodiolus thermophilus thioautotrophic gill symbiont]CAC9483872.1 hypothetical protein [uncultured Gammaproteobacteria bacterium]SSC09952.1 hypothetical protein BPUTEOSOX_807 [thiotrophic endosymbiont of Bathymodiolus puteoserpentis (Logatchev)]CAC9492082.1 hypothetical protein [uncultured Gammaproteobacteria bacterium]